MFLAWLWQDTVLAFAGVRPSGSQVYSGDGCTPVSETTSDIIGRRWLSPCKLEKMFPDSSCCVECALRFAAEWGLD